MQGAYLTFLGSPILPPPRAPAQPRAGTVSPHSPKPCAIPASCHASHSPSLPLPVIPLLSPCAVGAACALVCPWHSPCASAVPHVPPGIPCTGMRVLRKACWQTRPAVPRLLSHALRVQAVAFGCRAAGQDCSAGLAQRCRAAANPHRQSQPGQFPSGKASILASPALAGPPALWCLTSRGSLRRAALHLCRHGGGGEGRACWALRPAGWPVASRCPPVSQLHLFSLSCSGCESPGASTVPFSPAPA